MGLILLVILIVVLFGGLNTEGTMRTGGISVAALLLILLILMLLGAFGPGPHFYWW